jgi:hypothetical protein
MTNNLIQCTFEKYLERNPVDDITVTFLNETNYHGIVIESSEVSANWLNHACYYLLQNVHTIEARWRLEGARDNTYIIELSERSTVFTVPTTVMNPLMRFN